MLADYGKLHVSGADYTVLRPDSVDTATRGWRTALAEGRARRWEPSMTQRSAAR